MTLKYIETEINSLLKKGSKLGAVSFTHKLMRATENKKKDLQDFGGLKVAKEMIDKIQNLSNPGKQWITDCKDKWKAHYKLFRYINIKDI